MLRARTGVLARLVVIVVCAAALSGCALLTPQFPNRPAARSSVSQIAYIGSDDQVYIAEADGSGARLLSQAITGLSSADGWTFRWPTYSPDGRRLAFAGYQSRAGALQSSAVLAGDTDHATAAALLESPELAPIYLYWSPDSRHLSALLQRRQTLELHLLDAAGTESPRRLAVGQPLYWSWSRDGTTLAVHIGGDGQMNDDAWVGLVHTESGSAREERFSDSPGGFRAPAWSPSGEKLAFVALGGGASLLSIRDGSGGVVRVASSQTDIAFNWSPDGEWLAFASASDDAPALYDGVEIIRPDGTERHRLTSEPQVGFFWAPDGKRLALLGVDSAARALAWSTVQIDGQSRRALATFAPSTDFAFQLPFFDQFAQSTSVWSPDSRRIVYGSEGGAERRNGNAGGERIMVLDVEGQSPPTSAAAGGAAVWSPARR
jgi:Tol biopolymer transport system component